MNIELHDEHKQTRDYYYLNLSLLRMTCAILITKRRSDTFSCK